MDQHGAFFVNSGQSAPDPVAHSIFMDTEEIRDLLHCIASVSLNEAVIWVSFAHALVGPASLP